MRLKRLWRSSTLSASVLVCLLIAGTPTWSLAGDLTLKVDGIRSERGNILVALYDDPDAFSAGSQTQTVSSVQLRSTKGTIRFTWHGLSPGVYALAIMHDENSNGKMELKGPIPLEGYAYSQGAGKTTVPSFKEAGFEITNQGQTLATQVIYFKR